MKLIVPILLSCLLVLLLYPASKRAPFKNAPYMAKQTVIGLLFGAASAFASFYGVELLGTVVNVRDAAPLTAGLIFGAPAGIIAGVIGGLYRWFSVAWGAGEYTRLACTVATILAGFMAAGLRKFIFDDKKPSWGYGFCIAAVCEVIHMLLIFLTNMHDASYAFGFVKGATIPMILGNGAAVCFSIFIVMLINREKLRSRNPNKRIAQTFQRWLLVCIVVALVVTGVFTFSLQNDIAQIETREVFTTAISDVLRDVRGKSDQYILEIVREITESYRAAPDVPLQALAEEYGVIEINIVAEDGLIVNSTEPGLTNSFNMNSTAQSAEFMVLTQGEESYVQEYGPVGSDGKTMRKFGGMALEGGGYVQVGYSSEQFREMLDVFVTDVTKNRHVGSGGFVAVCDENLNLVTQTKMNGKHISTIGIKPNGEMQKGISATKLYKADVSNGEGGRSEKYSYAFTFVEGYCIIAAMPAADAMFMRDVSVYNSIFMQVLVFATLFVFIYFLIKRVVIDNLKKVNYALGQITEGNLEVRVDVRSNRELASLSDDINSTVSTLKSYIAEADARIDKELEYAKQIQLSALPTVFPDNDDYGIYARMIAAKEVGGDFYDFYKTSDGKVAFLVADVSGKGIPAAMFMMTAKTIIKDLAESGMPVEEVFVRANEKLCENNESGMFVTAWMGILDVATGRLCYANAGHNPPLLMRRDGSFEYLRSRTGFVLAGMEGVKYRANEMHLGAGDRIFLYTDGVTEATDTGEGLYGEGRLLDYLNDHKTDGATLLLTGLKADIDSFVGEAPQFDDITMLVLDYKTNKGGLGVQKKTFTASTDALGDFLRFAEEAISACNCPPKTVMAVCVALEELFVNVASYAYGGGEGSVDFSVGFDGDSRTLTLRLADRGTPFDPLSVPDPDITLSAEERQIGGLGIFIAKKTMDSIEYAYVRGENVLTMTKKV